MTKFKTYQISLQREGHTVSCRKFTVARLLGFLAAPTSDNWDRVIDPVDNAGRVELPWSHACNNGNTDKSISGPGCINHQHGRYEPKRVNEDRKPCSERSCRALCPGHLYNNEYKYCIFVDKSSGRPLPCRNQVAGLPAVCPHPAKCW